MTPIRLSDHPQVESASTLPPPSANSSSTAVGQKGGEPEAPSCCGGRAAAEVLPARELAVHPLPPESQNDFYSIPDVARIARIDAWQHNGRLGQQLVEFLKKAVQDRGLDLVSRNNIANALELQESPTPDLFRLFLTMADDTRESASWRDYAVQHLASCASFASDVSVVVEALMRMASEVGTDRAGTSLVQIHRLIRENVIETPDGFPDRLLAIMADSRNDALMRSTAVRLYGELFGAEAVPMLRRFAGDDSPAIRRVAIAFLGRHPSSESDDIVHRALTDADPSVVAAAEAASRLLVEARVDVLRAPDRTDHHLVPQEHLQ